MIKNKTDSCYVLLGKKKHIFVIGLDKKGNSRFCDNNYIADTDFTVLV